MGTGLFRGHGLRQASDWALATWEGSRQAECFQWLAKHSQGREEREQHARQREWQTPALLLEPKRR